MSQDLTHENYPQLIFREKAQELRTQHEALVASSKEELKDRKRDLARLKSKISSKRDGLEFWNDWSHWGDYDQINIRYLNLSSTWMKKEFRKFLNQYRDRIEEYYTLEDEIKRVDHEIHREETQTVELEYAESLTNTHYVAESLESRAARLEREFNKARHVYDSVHLTEEHLDHINELIANLKESEEFISQEIADYKAAQKAVIAAHEKLHPHELEDVTDADRNQRQEDYRTAVETLKGFSSRLSVADIESSYQTLLFKEIIDFRIYSTNEEETREQLKKLNDEVVGILAEIKEKNKVLNGWKVSRSYTYQYRNAKSNWGHVWTRGRKEYEEAVAAIQELEPQVHALHVRVRDLTIEIHNLQSTTLVGVTDRKMGELLDRFSKSFEGDDRYEVVDNLAETHSNFVEEESETESALIEEQAKLATLQSKAAAKATAQNAVHAKYKRRIAKAQKALDDAIANGDSEEVVNRARITLTSAEAARDQELSIVEQEHGPVERQLSNSQDREHALRGRLELVKTNITRSGELFKEVAKVEEAIISSNKERTKTHKATTAAQKALLPNLLWEVHRDYNDIVSSRESGTTLVDEREKRKARIEENLDQVKRGIEVAKERTAEFEALYEHHYITSEDIRVLDLLANRYESMIQEYEDKVEWMESVVDEE